MGRWSRFKRGVSRIVSGDVSKGEVVGNFERRIRSTPSVVSDDFLVGTTRILTGTVGKPTPTTTEVMQRRAHQVAVDQFLQRNPDADVRTRGGRQPNPTYREALDRTTETVHNFTENVVGDTLDIALNITGGAVDGVKGSLAKFLKENPVVVAGLAVGGAFLLSK